MWNNGGTPKGGQNVLKFQDFKFFSKHGKKTIKPPICATPHKLQKIIEKQLYVDFLSDTNILITSVLDKKKIVSIGGFYLFSSSKTEVFGFFKPKSIR